MASRYRPPLRLSSGLDLGLPASGPGNSVVQLFQFLKPFPTAGDGDAEGWRRLPALELCHPLRIPSPEELVHARHSLPNHPSPVKVSGGYSADRELDALLKETRKAREQLLQLVESRSDGAIQCNSFLEFRLRQAEFASGARDCLAEVGATLSTLRMLGLTDGSLVELAASPLGPQGSPERHCLARIRALTKGRLCGCPISLSRRLHLRLTGTQNSPQLLLTPWLGFQLGLNVHPELLEDDSQQQPQRYEQATVLVRVFRPRSLLDGGLPISLPDNESPLPSLQSPIPTAAAAWVRSVASGDPVVPLASSLHGLQDFLASGPRILQLGRVFPVPTAMDPDTSFWGSDGNPRSPADRGASGLASNLAFFQIHGLFMDDTLFCLASSPVQTEARRIGFTKLVIIPDPQVDGSPADGYPGTALPARLRHFLIDPSHTMLAHGGAPAAHSAAPYLVDDFLSPASPLTGVAAYGLGLACSVLREPLRQLHTHLRESLLRPSTAHRLPQTPALLLTGKRGSGKRTLIARATRRLGLHLLEQNLFEACGTSVQALRESLLELATAARACAPCVLHLRRADALAAMAKASNQPQAIFEAEDAFVSNRTAVLRNNLYHLAEEAIGADLATFLRQLSAPATAVVAASPFEVATAPAFQLQQDQLAAWMLHNQHLSSNNHPQNLSSAGGNHCPVLPVFVVFSASDGDQVPAPVQACFVHKLELALPNRRHREQLFGHWLGAGVDCNESGKQLEDPVEVLRAAEDNVGRAPASSDIMAFIQAVDRSSSQVSPPPAPGSSSSALMPSSSGWVDPELPLKLAKQTAGASCWDCFNLVLEAGAAQPMTAAAATVVAGPKPSGSSSAVPLSLDQFDLNSDAEDFGDEEEEPSSSSSPLPALPDVGSAVAPVAAPTAPAGETLLAAAQAQQLRFAASRPSAATGIPNVRWEDIGGLEHVKSEIMDIIELPLRFPDLFASGVKKRSGVLLWGPPGVGKTLVAKAVATECQLNFISVKGPELLNMYIGESEQNVRAVFQQAREAAPCVLFFDELDALAPARGSSGSGGGANVMDRVVSQLLAEIDGMNQGAGGTRDESQDVFVIGATNRPDLIESALLRPGRLDRCVYLSLPTDDAGQLKILQALTRKFQMASDVDLLQVARRCPFTFTGADFYALCSDALLLALRRCIDAAASSEQRKQKSGEGVRVCQQDFLEACAALKPSLTAAELQRYELLRTRFEDGR